MRKREQSPAHKRCPPDSPAAAQAAEHEPAEEDLLGKRREEKRKHRKRDERPRALKCLLNLGVRLDSDLRESPKVGVADNESGNQKTKHQSGCRPKPASLRPAQPESGPREVVFANAEVNGRPQQPDFEEDACPERHGKSQRI